ncbi:hypothetical protein KPH14_007768 [Odynerus spinipes]|uniref:Ionotropic glutamate receptor L-glutamate and glycine-binding domain-containing protein n=1 Tax=Odynerus spinipes TaxID=1348599 RepID=A0AAD9RJ49_9HYME|nr:hypothetical protein KPH14_007768 [Odynerus spinipes]
MKTYLFLYIILKDLRASGANEEKILNNSITSSWITKDVFIAALEATFTNSHCCNVRLRESTRDIHRLFRQFVDNYSYEYSLNSNTYECKAYFLLGSMEEEIVEELKKVPPLSTTEIFVVLDNYTGNDSSIFNATIYGNANANVMSRSGLWSLSENYLAPRIFHSIDKYERTNREAEGINFNGRQLRVSTFYRPPVSYLNRTVTRVIDDTEEEIFAADDDIERDGIEMKIFMLMAEKLNFTWIITKPKDRYGKRYNETAWQGGVIQLIHNNKIDIAFASIWLTIDHHTFVDLSEPWYQLFIHFLVPRPRPTTSFWALTRPFSVNTWILLVLAIFLQSVCMYGHAQLNPRCPTRFRSFLITFIELTGRLLGAWAPRNMVNVKLQLHLWQTMGLILVTAYSSSLAARLTGAEYEDRIDSIRQFLEANLSWGRAPPIPEFRDYFDYDDPYASQLPNKYRKVENVDEIHENIVKGNYAIIGRFVGSVFFPEDEVRNEDLKDYRVMKEMVGKFYASFAVQPWLLPPVNSIILRLKESGIITFHLHDVLRRRASFNLREVLIEHDGRDGRTRVLTLTPLGAAFSLLFFGLSISTLIFYLEIKYACKSKSIRKTLQYINKNRKRRLTSYGKKQLKSDNN